jgi:hypothetical protein
MSPVLYLVDFIHSLFLASGLHGENRTQVPSSYAHPVGDSSIFGENIMFRLFDAINLAIIVALTASSPAFADNCCTNTPTSVPEPASIALLAVGVGGVLFSKRRSRLSRVASALAIVAAAALWAQSGVAATCCPLP